MNQTTIDKCLDKVFNSFPGEYLYITNIHILLIFLQRATFDDYIACCSFYIWCIVNCRWLWICYKCIFIRVSNQIDINETIVALKCLCTESNDLKHDLSFNDCSASSVLNLINQHDFWWHLHDQKNIRSNKSRTNIFHGIASGYARFWTELFGYEKIREEMV